MPKPKGPPTISQVLTAINALPDAVAAKVPSPSGPIVDYAKKHSNGAWDLTTDLAEVVQPVADAVTAATAFVADVRAQLAGFDEAKQTAFRADLNGFVADLADLGAEMRRVVFDLKDGDEFRPGFAKAAISAMPDAVLFLLYEALDPIPLWREAPAEVLKPLRSIPSIADLKAAARAAECDLLLGAAADADEVKQRRAGHKLVEDVATTTKILTKIVDLAIHHVPRDLAAEVTVFGGGGITISSHPLHVFLSRSKWVLDMLGIAFATYLDAYQSCFDERAAQLAATQAEAAAAELATWRQDVTEALDAIRAAVA